MTPGQKLKLRTFMREYMLRCEHSEKIIHYSQDRPMTHLGVIPEKGFTADCSGYVTGTYDWARLHTGIFLPDPNGLNYAYHGSGNTSSLRSAAGSVKVPKDHKFFVGDQAHYRNEDHVMLCSKDGTWITSEWSSHGREVGPRREKINSYRPEDFLYVIRVHSLL